MDIVDVFSSDSEDNQRSINSEGKETVHSQTHRTKAIKKHYEPVTEGGKTYKFEDNPAQYKRMRKKIQNRESATRVRGRKKNAFENLEQEAQFLRKDNSQLQLINAKLQTENKSLKEQLEFMKTLIKPHSKHDLVQDYLSEEVLTHPSSHVSQGSRSPPSMQEMQEEESPLFEEFNWMRSESSASHGFGWASLAVFTIVLAFFVLPNDSSINSSSAIAFQKDGVTEIKVPLSFSIIQLLMWVLDCGKVLAKYLLIMGYIWVLYGKIRAYVKGRKLKSV